MTSFVVGTYNTLASAYIKPSWYPHTQAKLLTPAHRLPRVVERLAHLSPDVWCLQEVEEPTYEAITQRLGPMEYVGHYAEKGLGKPDGCATFYRSDVFAESRVKRLEYCDASLENDASGHVALLLTLEYERGPLLIANTHLKWDPPDTPRDQKYGYRQAVELLEECDRLADQSPALVVCGDFNTHPTSDVMAAFQAAGLLTTHTDSTAYTSNANGPVKIIDYIMYSAALEADPIALRPIAEDTPLPGDDEPSDHLPVLSRLSWREAALAGG